VTYTWKVDTTAPVISCNADGTVTAIDECDGAVTPNLQSATSQKNTPCFGQTTTTNVWTATDSCGNTSTQTCVVVTGQCVNGCSFTLGGFGGNGAPSAYVPSGLTVGGTYTLTFNSKLAIQTYLKNVKGTPGQLAASYPNPTSNHGEGIFGPQVVSLKINVGPTVPNPIGGFHLCGVNTTLLSSKGATLTAAQAAALEGKTVSQILADAGTVLGGGSSAYGLSVSQLNAMVTLLNESFDNCLLSAWAKTYMCP
jgi:hypothetical protein